jgi:hypothetical protein
VIVGDEPPPPQPVAPKAKTMKAKTMEAKVKVATVAVSAHEPSDFRMLFIISPEG